MNDNNSLAKPTPTRSQEKCIMHDYGWVPYYEHRLTRGHDGKVHDRVKLAGYFEACVRCHKDKQIGGDPSY